MGLDLGSQNFNLVKFQEMFPRNPGYGVRFSLGTWPLNSKKTKSRRPSPDSARNLAGRFFLGTWLQNSKKTESPGRGQTRLGILAKFLVESGFGQLEEVAPRFEEIDTREAESSLPLSPP